MESNWEPDCFLAWYRVSPRRKWLVQVLSRKEYTWGSEYFGFYMNTGKEYVFNGKFIERIS